MTPLAMMWTPGPMELIVILVIVMIFFGVGKLPQLGAALGKGISGFKRSAEGLEEPVDVGRESAAKPDA
jgi:sec-independent protein translocase protein TatA